MASRQIRDRRVADIAVTELNRHAVVIGFTHVRPAQPFFAQIAAQAVHILFLELAERRVHIDFHQEVNTAAQVKTQLHRFGRNKKPDELHRQMR